MPAVRASERYLGLIKVSSFQLAGKTGGFIIVQCGLKSQQAYIYIYATSVTLRNAIKSPVTFLIRVITMSVRSVCALLLQL